MTTIKSLVGASLVLALGLAWSGCARRARVAYVTYAQVDPPAPQIEETPEAPDDDDYVWVNGYWYWNGGGYQWVAGYWAPRPAPGYVWVRSGWVQADDGYRFVPGRWHVEARAPSVTYVHPAPAVRVGVVPRYRAVSPSRASGASVRVVGSGRQAEGATVRPVDRGRSTSGARVRVR